MIKKNLLKAAALGLCMSVLFTGTAFAQAGGGISSSYEGVVSDEANALFEKQAEIDRYVFYDHAEDIRKQGFEIYYTGVADTFVEIGINPYSEEHADYLYDIFGKEIVKVVPSEEVVLYNMAEEDMASDSDETITDTADAELVMDMGLDTPVSNMDEPDRKPEDANGDEDQKLEIQIESLPADLAEEGAPDVVTDIAPDEAAELARQSGLIEDGQEVQVVSAQDDAADLVSIENVEEKSQGLPSMILIAGGIVVLGSAVFLVNKKRRSN
ncbi:MAG: hypothetical protein GX359_08415 [Clostridiales bacterium]|nr:hypothetical protein [Clostridiales bacterium]